MKIPSSLMLVAQRLGDLRERVVFVGGMIRPLLVTDPAVAGARPTDDVDLIVDVPNAVAYYELNKALREKDFRESQEEGAPMCRWRVDGVSVDVMPVDPAILGFSNVWYVGAHESSLTLGPNDCQIRLLDAPHFCASKLEAFFSRGEGDLLHPDLEDIIAIVDGRPTLLAEITAAPAEIREFLAKEIAALLKSDAFLEALPGHLAGDEASQGRLPLILQRLRAIAALDESARATPAGATRPTTHRTRASRARSPQIAPTLATSPLGAEPAHIFAASTNLHSASYDSRTSTLIIQFRSGAEYEYSSVPATIYSGLLTARSAGRYHHYWIRGRYPYRRLRS